MLQVSVEMEEAIWTYEPADFRFDTADLDAECRKELPAWEGEPAFTEHSYRTVVGDGEANEMLYMQNVGYDVAHMSLLTREGQWRGAGELKWPWGGEYPEPQWLRLCYPNVIMRDRAVHFFGVWDIVEPMADWREEKYRITGRDWDYVFRRLFYATTPDVSQQPFGEWVEIANFDSTAGATRNCDVWVGPDSTVHLLWVQTNTDARLRDRFFPGEQIMNTLEYAVLRNGGVAGDADVTGRRPGWTPRDRGALPRFAEWAAFGSGAGQAPERGRGERHRVFPGGLEPGHGWDRVGGSAFWRADCGDLSDQHRARGVSALVVHRSGRGVLRRDQSPKLCSASRGPIAD